MIRATDRPRRALVVANGDLPPDAVLQPAILNADFVLAVDGGANGLIARGIVPDAVLGDFDSLTIDLPVSVRRIPAPDQDYTDLDKAIQYLRFEGYASATLVGVTGNRLDHTFGALSILANHGHHISLTLLDGIGAARLVVERLTLTTHPGQTVSLLALGRVDGIDTAGLHWELTDDFLAAGIRDGISNVARGESVSVQAASGDLIVYLHHA